MNVYTINGKNYVFSGFIGMMSEGKLYRLEMRPGFSTAVQVPVRKNSAEFKRVTMAMAQA